MATTRFIDHLLEGDHASRPSAGSVPQGTLYSCTTHGLIYQSDGVSSWTTWATLGASGAITSSGLTMATARLLGRTTASTGAVEEITVGTGLALSAGSLTATGGGGMTPAGNTVTTDETQSGNNSWADLATTGPAVTATVGAGGLAVVSIAADLVNTGSSSFCAMSFALSSGNTLAASDQRSIFSSGGLHLMYGATYYLSGLTPGSTVFTAKYNQFGTAGTSHYKNRHINVWV